MDSLGVTGSTTIPYTSNEPKINNPFPADEQRIAKGGKGFRIFRGVANEDLNEILKRIRIIQNP